MKKTIAWHPLVKETGPETDISKEIAGFAGQIKVVARLFFSGHIFYYGTTTTTYVGSIKENIWLCWKRLHDLGVPDDTLTQFLNSRVSAESFLRTNGDDILV